MYPQKSVSATRWTRSLIVVACAIFGSAIPSSISAVDAPDAGPAISVALMETSEPTKLIAEDPGEKSLFGFSVAIDDDTAIIGAVWDEHSGLYHPGAAYIFRRDQGGSNGWGQVVKLTAPAAESSDHFGWSVAIDGETAVVGARYSNPFGFFEAGSAFLFMRDEGGVDAWGQAAELTPSDAEAGDEFGNSVAIDGETAVVGSVWDDHSGFYHPGSVYIYMQDQGGENEWGQVSKLTAEDADTSDEFGTSVAIIGDTIVVVALLDDHPGLFNSGSAYIFKRDPEETGVWAQVAKITASDAEAGDRFGASVSISGDTVVVGVAEYAGESAYVFERNFGGPEAWGQVAKLTASDAASHDDFGYSVAIDGDTIVVGAQREGPSGKGNAGAAYLFTSNEGGTGAWTEVAKLTAYDADEEDRFGISVAIRNNLVLVGANGDDHSDLTGAGSAYLFQITTDAIFSDGFECGDTTMW